MLSREATAAIGSALNTLTETVKKHEPSLEDVVRETLRPMLMSWLDENLPRVVEGLVQAEIERVTRGERIEAATLTYNAGQSRSGSIARRQMRTIRR